MTIGEAAAASGVSAKMIRYYEGIGLIDAAQRSEAGYRVYATADIHTLRFIGRARDFGMPMTRIKQLVSLWADHGRASRDVKRLAMQHVTELRAQVAELSAMAEALQTLADCCQGNDRPDCPILEDFAGKNPGRSNPRGRLKRGSRTGPASAG